MSYPDPVKEKLRYIYEDLIWLANRPHITPRQARAWYSQVLATTMVRQVRVFTGYVSLAAIDDVHQKLVLEHYNRLSFELSLLIEHHINNQINAPEEFIKLIDKCERVHITTDEENHKAKKEQGNYEAAGIQLHYWNSIETDKRRILWERKLKGKVSNSSNYSPNNNL